MKQSFSIRRIIGRLMLLTALASGTSSTLAQTTNAPGRLTYDSFRMVSDRNIFNPNRVARSTGRSSQTRSTRPASRIESFSLVGIMAYEKGTFAFFDGTKSDYKHALQTGGTIGEYQVTQVSADSVKLAHGTNTFDLKVGMQMRREDEGDWFLSDGSETTRRRVATSSRSWTRGSSRSGTGEGEEMISEEGSPEVIVVEGGETGENGTDHNGNNPETNGNNGNDQPTQADNASDSNGVTDPVLLRLMQRRQQMNR